MDDSTISKMQLHYWEAKQTFLKKIKRKEDDFIVASDAELDAKLELLKSIDDTNQNLLNLLELYQDRVCALAQEECIFGRFLRECGKHDTTKAGNLMSSSGKTFLFAGHQFIMIRNVLIRSFRDVQTFQYRAVTDTFDTVEQMEKSRTGYRAALLWMKDVSQKLDPDVYMQMDKFKKIQNHVREKKKSFEKLKIDTIQKIDLLSASRCNLFNNILLSYQNILKSVWDKTTKTMNIFVDTFKSHLNYQFTMLKELNDVDSNVDEAQQNFEEKLKEILSGEQNTNEMDMLIFFEADYADDNNNKDNVDDNNKKRFISGRRKNGSIKKNDNLKNSKNPKNKDKENQKEISMESKALLDFNFETNPEFDNENDDGKEKEIKLEHLNSYMPSSLIDLGQMIQTNYNDNEPDKTISFFDKLMLSKDVSFNKLSTNDADKVLSMQNDDQQKSSSSSKTTSKISTTAANNNSTLDTWLNLFADIDPLSNPQEFDKRFSSDKTSINDRNC
ncbi:Islet cell autoantigen 1 [Dermatophagoides pteronyssinus]|uniref:Islet cell autoantigen 1 n=1 Tax=Dermatophagoides pteronyssinus TaxID=6956 RepID=A0ABQ8JNV0_DERPT|nr:Islet cell autoantigen 1 [Dermatophagoides pteronyssinus]